MRTEQHQTQDPVVERAAFPRLPKAVRQARNWARSAYCRAGGGQSDVCALLVSELVTNAVEHAAGDLVEVTVWCSTLEVDVRDSSPRKPEIRVPDDDAESGRGLFLVSELSSHYEVIPLPDGKISRFRLDEGA